MIDPTPYDGIEERDAIIKLQRREIDRLRGRIKEFWDLLTSGHHVEALTEIMKELPDD